MMRRGGNGISLGVKNGQSKLTDKAVVEIRNLYKGGGHTYQTLADIYGVGMRTVADAITQKTWGHVEQETVPLEKAR